MSKLEIKNLNVSVEGKEILHNVNLTINTNEINVIMGPNGTGKSTLANAIMGHYKYEVTKGEILLDGENVLEMSVDERSKKGLFLAMQYPAEIEGVTNSEFIKTAMEARLEEDEHISLFKYIKELEKATKDLKMNSDLPHRFVNVGFSGGEKKRNEILQMKLLKPKFAILDEIDSGLDVDAIKSVANGIKLFKTPNTSVVIITHSTKLLRELEPNFVHVLVDGKIVHTGDALLADQIDKNGYEGFKLQRGKDG